MNKNFIIFGGVALLVIVGILLFIFLRPKGNSEDVSLSPASGSVGVGSQAGYTHERYTGWTDSQLENVFLSISLDFSALSDQEKQLIDSGNLGKIYFKLVEPSSDVSLFNTNDGFELGTSFNDFTSGNSYTKNDIKVQLNNVNTLSGTHQLKVYYTIMNGSTELISDKRELGTVFELNTQEWSELLSALNAGPNAGDSDITDIVDKIGIITVFEPNLTTDSDDIIIPSAPSVTPSTELKIHPVSIIDNGIGSAIDTIVTLQGNIFIINGQQYIPILEKTNQTFVKFRNSTNVSQFYENSSIDTFILKTIDGVLILPMPVLKQPSNMIPNQITENHSVDFTLNDNNTIFTNHSIRGQTIDTTKSRSETNGYYYLETADHKYLVVPNDVTINSTTARIDDDSESIINIIKIEEVIDDTVPSAPVYKLIGNSSDKQIYYSETKVNLCNTYANYDGNVPDDMSETATLEQWKNYLAVLGFYPNGDDDLIPTQEDATTYSWRMNSSNKNFIYLRSGSICSNDSFSRIAHRSKNSHDIRLKRITD